MPELHHERRGSGEPILLIQGMSGHSGHWGEPFLAALARDFEVITFDNRGTGRSPRVQAEFTLAELADDAVGVLDVLGLDSAHVLGISMGGMVAQEVVLRHPDRVRTLTLGCTYAGGEGQRLTPSAVWQRLAEAMGSGDRDRAFRTAFEVNVSSRFAASDEHYEGWRATASEKPVAVQVIMKQVQAIGQHDTSGRLHEVTVPTLVIHGTEDQMLPVGNAAKVAELIPGARLEILEDVGHLFFVEEPERSAALVRTHALVAQQAQG